ncbi:MAG: alpha-glucosidase C-terminal domain-containing protein [Acidobacteriia bacterium]|nr:alpha-glucosidase C-terminal domain-containing protein [Terriglobia bacterium]
MIRLHSNSQCDLALRLWIPAAVAVAVIAAFTGIAMAAGATADAPAGTPGFYLHHFEYDPPAGAAPQKVAVGGEFNNWADSGFPMKPDGAGHFVADVELAEGPHSYRFFVDGAWVNDSDQHSEADLEESNGIRGHNSAVVVGPDGRGLPKPQPGRITVEGLHYVQTSTRYFDPISATEARIAFAAQAGNLTGAAVYSLEGQNWRRDDVYLVDTRAGMDFFAGAVLSQTPNLTFFFELRDGAATGYYAGGKYFSRIADARRNAWKGKMQPAFETPAWAQHAVWYQIFPERFRNGDKANDPANTAAWTMKWNSAGSAAPGAAAPGRGAANAGTPGAPSPARGGRGNSPGNRRYGGDIQGIQAQLPYLRSLGVNCIYLNPVFKSPSVHKYDTTDYRHVDDAFGAPIDNAEISGETEDPATWKWTKSDKVLLDFLAEAHRQGFKVVLDGVFNHAGSQFAPFLDVRQNGQKSKYADWFNISNWNPVTWISFGGRAGGNMPELKKDPVTGLTPGPRDFFLNITKRWLAPDGDPSRGADGFRLDYAQNVPRAFWVTYRKMVKAVKPDAYIAGEIWTPATSYLSGDAWDATMQYSFSNAVQAFFIGGSQKPITASVFADRLRQFTITYPFQVSLNQMNLLDSHDTDRWASRFVNADRPPTPAPGAAAGRRSYNTSKPTELEWQRMEQSISVQMTAVGAPMVYYGDEVGMWGATDPDDRQPMIWKDLAPYEDPEVTFNQGLFDAYVRLIAIHRRFPALQTGFAHTLLADDERNILAYSRDLGDAHVYVVVNRSDSARSVDLPIGPLKGDSMMIDWLDPAQATVQAAPATAPATAPVGRPRIQAVSGAKAAVVSHNGKATVSLKPWGTMILAPAGAN